MSLHLAVDLGAESGRLIVGRFENGVMQTEELHRFPTQVCEIRGAYFWNIYRYYDEILSGLKRYVKRFGPRLDTLGVDTWGCDFCMLDHAGNIRGLPGSYRRMVSQKPYEIIEARMGRAKLYEHCGIQFLDFNTLNQLLYERLEDPHYFDDAHGMMFMGDALHFLLGAPPACEYSTASISQMVDTRAQAWDAEVFRAFELPEALKTKLVHAGDAIGTLSDRIADMVGLEHGTRLITPAVHDTASASVAVPAQGDDWATISSGTWSLASVELDAPVNNAHSYEMNISNSAGVLGKSLFLKNIMGLWIIQQCKYAWEKARPELSYAQIVELAEAAPAFAAWIDPDDPTFFQPGGMPEKVCAYIKRSGQPVSLDPQADIGPIARIVYESLAMKYRQVFEKIAAISGKTIRTLYVTGGGSNNKLLNRFTANAMNLSVTAGPRECSALGNLLMQLYGFGSVKNLDEIRAVVGRSVELETCAPTDPDGWNSAYRAYLRATTYSSAL